MGLSTVQADDSRLPDLGDTVSATLTQEQEYTLGRAWLRQLRAAAPVMSDPVVQDYIERLCYRLAFHSPLTSADFAVAMLDDPDINAFSVPGGVFGVNTGLLIYAESEAEIAAVLAHELGHLSQRHFVRGISDSQHNQWLYMGALLTSLALAAKGNSNAGVAAIMSTQAAMAQHELAFSRQQEQEADRVGMQTLVDSGIDPHAMPDFFARLQKQTGQSLSAPEFLQDHPVTEARIADTLNRANQYPQKLTLDSLDYQLVRQRILTAYVAQSGNGVEHYKQALRDVGADSPQRAAATLGLGLAQLRARKLADARTTLSALLNTAPDRVDYLIALSDVDLADHNFDAILKRLEKPLQLNPGNYPLTMYYARAAISAGKPQLAIHLLEAEALERGEDPQVWQLLADAHTLNKNAMGVFRSRAEVYFLYGNDEKAIEQLRQAAELSRQDYPLNAKIQKRIREIRAAKEAEKF